MKEWIDKEAKKKYLSDSTNTHEQHST
jgi:hypothetical protein